MGRIIHLEPLAMFSVRHDPHPLLTGGPQLGLVTGRSNLGSLFHLSIDLERPPCLNPQVIPSLESDGQDARTGHCVSPR